MERTVGDGENVLRSLLGDDPEGGGHAGVEEFLRIGSGNNRRVGDDVLNRFGRLAHLDDAAAKDAVSDRRPP